MANDGARQSEEKHQHVAPNSTHLYPVLFVPSADLSRFVILYRRIKSLYKIQR